MGIKKRVQGFYRTALEIMKGIIGRKRLSKASQRLDLRKIIEIAYMFAFLLLSAGIINFLIEGNIPDLAQYIIVPLFRYQNLIETIVNFFTVMMGAAGFYLIYLSGKKISTKKTVNLYLISGFIILISSVSILLFILSVKYG